MRVEMVSSPKVQPHHECPPDRFLFGRLMLILAISLLAPSSLFAREVDSEYESAPDLTSAPSISEFLFPDGGLDFDALIDRGYEGPLESDGFRFRTDELGQPTFSRSSSGSEGDDTWSDEFSIAGTDGPVYTLVSYAGDLIVGGSFTAAGDLPMANSIAGYDGTDWFELVGTDGMTLDYDACVNAMVVEQGELYVGGFFSDPGNNIAKWDGTDWSALGTGTNDEVLALETVDGSVYVGGYFTQAGSVTTNAIASWDGTSWHALGSGLESSSGTPHVRALCRRPGGQEALFVGGRFESSGGTALNHIANWRNSDWHSMGPSGSEGLNAPVNALAVHPGTRDIFIGGTFSASNNGVTLNYVAVWPNSSPSWVALDQGLSAPVLSVRLGGDGLYVGGTFSQDFPGTIELNNIGRWATGGFWSAVGDGTSGAVHAFTRYPPSSTTLVVGGEFTTVDGSEGLGADHLAEWRAGLWDRVDGDGVSGQVNALAVFDGSLVIGGDFASAGGTVATRVAAWNGMDWSDLDGGVGADAGAQSSETVWALTIHDGALIAGGEFLGAGDAATAVNIAAWDGVAWSDFGESLVGGPVYSLASDGTYLYAGGDFDKDTGGQALMRVARWGGSDWEPLGGPGFENNGVNAAVYALTLFQGRLVVGGAFDSIFGVGAASRIASWNVSTGTTLEPFSDDDQFDGEVRALATNLSETTLFAGGAFSQPDPYVVQWAGGVWSPVAIGGSFFDGPIYALEAVGEQQLYAAGEFAFAGGDSASRVAFYDGIDWAPLGSGLDDTGLALTHFEDNLFAGGAFVRAGGKVSYHIGERLEDPADLIPESAEPHSSSRIWAGPPSPNPSSDEVVLQFGLARETAVRVEIHDVQGRRVAVLFDGTASAGLHRWSWDGRSDSGSPTRPGVYFARVRSGGDDASVKLIRLDRE